MSQGEGASKQQEEDGEPLSADESPETAPAQPSAWITPKANQQILWPQLRRIGSTGDGSETERPGMLPHARATRSWTSPLPECVVEMVTCS